MFQRASLVLGSIIIFLSLATKQAGSSNSDELSGASMKQASLGTDDPFLKKQWTHSIIESRAAWNLSNRSDEVIVAVVDGGVDITHPDLRDNIWRNPRERANGQNDDPDNNDFIDDVQGWDFADDDGDPRADTVRDNHGTHVAGLIGAVIGNGVGVAGHANNVKIMPLKYLKEGTGYTKNSLRAIRYAIANGARVINLSSGDFKPKAKTLKLFKEAEEAGVLIVAAAGNYATNVDQKPYYPASYKISNLISVGATDSKDRLWRDSNYGISNVHIAAPGVSIYSTVNQGYLLKSGGKVDYLSKWGTSMSAPLVSAVAAMIFGRRPELSPAEVKEIILASADELPQLRGKVAGSRRLNARRAMELALSTRR